MYKVHTIAYRSLLLSDVCNSYECYFALEEIKFDLSYKPSGHNFDTHHIKTFII